MPGPVNPTNLTAQQGAYSRSIVAAMNSQDAAAPTTPATTAAAPAAARDAVQTTTAATGSVPAATVNLTGPQAPATQNTAPELFVNDKNQIVTSDGMPYMNTEMYLGQNDQIVDAQGKAIDLSALESQASAAPQAPTDADLTVMRRVKLGTAAASGALGVGMDYLWYRSTLGGMEGRLKSLQTASKAFKGGTSIQARIKNTPVLGAVANRLQNRRTGKIDGLQRSIKVAKMSAHEEGKFLAKEQLTALKAESKAFQAGKGMMGRMKDTPVVGSVAKWTQTRRQSTISRLQTELKSKESQVGTWTRVKNATRGRIFPTIMLASDGYSVYQGVKQLNSAGNARKWDDYLRIGGNAISAGGDVMALRRGHVGNAIAIHATGMVIGTVGNMFNDQD